MRPTFSRAFRARLVKAVPVFTDALCRRFVGGPVRSSCDRWLSSSPTDTTLRLALSQPQEPADDYFFFLATFRLVFFAAVFLAAGFVFALAFFTILPS
jgi:hypothetical protein